MGKESWGMTWRSMGVAIWLLTRRRGKADRAEGTKMAGMGGGKGGNHTGRTTCSPSATIESYSSLSVCVCVCMLTCAPMTDNAAHWIQHGGLGPDSTDATSLDRAWSV